jgi:hypothetical protein
MQAIIDVFKMEEVSVKSRVKIIKELGKTLNYQFSSNVTEALVYELVLALDPDNEIKSDKHYLHFVDHD